MSIQPSSWSKSGLHIQESAWNGQISQSLQFFSLEQSSGILFEAQYVNSKYTLWTSRKGSQVISVTVSLTGAQCEKGQICGQAD